MASVIASCSAGASGSCGAAPVRGTGLLQGMQQMSQLSEERLGSPASVTQDVDCTAVPFFGKRGGCYANDRMEHTVKIGVYADLWAWSSYSGANEQLLHDIEDLITEINVMSVHQFHLRFEIVNKIVANEVGARESPWWGECGDESDSEAEPDTQEGRQMTNLWESTDDRVGEAISILFTSCLGYTGKANPESFCETHNVITVAVPRSGRDLVINAKQQLGRSLGIMWGAELFRDQDPEQEIGIMYLNGNGEIDGCWQFDLHAKSQICPYLDSKVSNCGNGIVMSSRTECPGVGSVRVQTRKMARGSHWQITNRQDRVLCEGGKDVPYYDDSVFQESCCLDDGEYRLKCESPFADGWHGGTIEINGKTYCGEESSWRSIAVTFVLGATPTPAPPPCPDA